MSIQNKYHTILLPHTWIVHDFILLFFLHGDYFRQKIGQLINEHEWELTNPMFNENYCADFMRDNA